MRRGGGVGGARPGSLNKKKRGPGAELLKGEDTGQRVGRLYEAGGVNLNSIDQWRLEIQWPGSIKENGVGGGV